MNSAPDDRIPWLRTTLPIALSGSLLMWAAHPPLALGWLGWLAPIPWLLLIRAEKLPSRRPYRALWVAGFVFWLMAIHWLRLPHPATSLGWFALSAYLAFYLPAFVGLSRVALHSLAVPLWIAAPVVFTGLELARAHLLTGFLMGSLAHTQVNFTPLIQISDLVGEYGVDFVIMLVAACLTQILPVSTLRVNASSPPARLLRIATKLTPAVIVLTATLIYGHWRLNYTSLAIEDTSPRTLHIALIQGNSLAEWKADPSREREIMDEYISLSERAVAISKQSKDARSLDLIVWPETMFRSSLITFDPDVKLPPEVGRTTEEIASYGPQDLARLVARLGTPVLVGVDRIYYRAAELSDAKPQRPHVYNSAALVARDGRIIGVYDKIHRVMFGEYIPFADWLPFLYGLTPLTGGIQPGDDPIGLELDGCTYAPNICYETAIPHVIRRQVASLAARGETPDVLVNLTNDAWYWGSSELDMHLACGVFRAVEARRPLVIAANGGISAWIDRFGRIQAQSPRQQPDIILANIEPYSMPSPYIDLGDWFAGLCLAACLALAIVGYKTRRQEVGPAVPDS